MSKTKSFYATYRATGKNTLLGGVRKSETSRFQVEADAQLFLDQAIIANGGEKLCVGEVHESPLPPQIFRHCHPTISQALGGKCFGCKKVLTTEDAKQSEPVFTEPEEYTEHDDCVASGRHLTSCDDDGFCNFCGEQ